MKCLPFILLIAFASAAEWAVLLAGSSGYENYRHQADVAHMYGILTDHKFDPDHIITLMYGDIPTSKENPYPGTIYNHPGYRQRNYQEGLVIDYSKEHHLTRDLYVAILLGDEKTVSELSGIEHPKVLKSTAEDNIFLYYIDHGADGVVAMPEGKCLTSDMLIETFQKMHEKKMYKRMVYYLESCNAGTMWEELPTDINVYALSSTEPGESSWGTYCPPDDEIEGVNLGTCLGEVWSCFWLEQDDVADLKTLTLQKQFDDAKEFTKTSHPLQFGDMEIAKDVLVNYISADVSRRKNLRSSSKPTKQWNSRDIQMLYWKNRALNENDKEAYDMYMKVVERNLNADRYFQKLAKKVMGKDDTMLDTYISKKNWPCYNAVLDKYQSMYEFTDYSLQYARTLANICSLYKGKVEDILNAM